MIITKQTIRFVLRVFSNSVIFFLAPIVIKGDVVLGNSWLTPITASIFSGLWLTIAVELIWKVLRTFNVEVKGLIPWATGFFIINFFVVWAIARMAPFTGFGITRFYWAAALSAFFTLVQWLTKRVSEEFKI